MRAYQVVGLLVIGSGLAFTVGYKLGSERTLGRAPAGDASGAEEDCCPPLPASMAQSGEPPRIPPGNGLPCIVEFGSDECPDCQKMARLLDELAPKLEGKAEVIRLDTDVFPLEAKRWQLRMTPTQIFFNAEGEEVDRHESYLPADQLLAKLKAAGAELG